MRQDKGNKADTATAKGFSDRVPGCGHRVKVSNGSGPEKRRCFSCWENYFFRNAPMTQSAIRTTDALGVEYMTHLMGKSWMLHLTLFKQRARLVLGALEEIERNENNV